MPEQEGVGGIESGVFDWYCNGRVGNLRHFHHRDAILDTCSTYLPRILLLGGMRCVNCDDLNVHHTVVSVLKYIFMVYATNIKENCGITYILTCTLVQHTAFDMNLRVALSTLVSHVTSSTERSNKRSACFAVYATSILRITSVTSLYYTYTSS